MTIDEEWDSVKLKLRAGSRVSVQVTEHQPFGVFVSIPNIRFRGLVQITDFKDGARMTPAEYPAIGTEIQPIVLGYQEHSKQIWLGMRPTQLSRVVGEYRA